MIEQSQLSGAWSAAPTPFTTDGQIDVPSVHRMVEQHLRLDTKGLFIGGSCGEGPFLLKSDLEILIRESVEAKKKFESNILITAQVTGNSSRQMLDNIKLAKECGAEMAIVCDPWFTPIWMPTKMIEKYYLETVENSELPLGIYCLRPPLPTSFFEELFMHPNVRMVKDSTTSVDFMTIATKVQSKRADFSALNGNEWVIPTYMKAGYAGHLAGGGMVLCGLINKMLKAGDADNYAQAWKIQDKATEVLNSVYGEPYNESYLTAFKYAAVKMSVFSTIKGYVEFPLPDSRKKIIDKYVAENQDILQPEMASI